MDGEPGVCPVWSHSRRTMEGRPEGAPWDGGIGRGKKKWGNRLVDKRQGLSPKRESKQQQKKNELSEGTNFGERWKEGGPPEIAIQSGRKGKGDGGTRKALGISWGNGKIKPIKLPRHGAEKLMTGGADGENRVQNGNETNYRPCVHTFFRLLGYGLK